MVDEVEAAAEAELPLESIGSRLRRAREEAGLSLAQLGAETRIGERMLAAIETGDYAALPGRTYAIGFARSFAKSVGLNDAEVAAAVRAELAEQAPVENRRPIQTFEPGDPARVPSARLAWLAGVLLVVALVLGIALLPKIFAPGGSLPSILAPDQASPAANQTVASAVPVAESGSVVFTALEPKVWVKFSDAQGNQLFQKEMVQGESWTVPTDKGEVLVMTARPDALAITIGGQAVPKLSDVQQTIKDVPVSAAALLRRGTQPPAPAASAAPAPVQRAQPERRRVQRQAAPQAEASPSASAAPAPAAVQPAPAPAPSAT